MRSCYLAFKDLPALLRGKDHEESSMDLFSAAGFKNYEKNWWSSSTENILQHTKICICDIAFLREKEGIREPCSCTSPTSKATKTLSSIRTRSEPPSLGGKSSGDRRLNHMFSLKNNMSRGDSRGARPMSSSAKCSVLASDDDDDDLHQRKKQRAAFPPPSGSRKRDCAASTAAASDRSPVVASNLVLNSSQMDGCESHNRRSAANMTRWDLDSAEVNGPS